MHSANLDLSIEEITKIEGNASVELAVRDGVVTVCKFAIVEMRRFFMQAIRENRLQESRDRLPASAEHAQTPICLRA
jgi:hypothetical protein